MGERITADRAREHVANHAGIDLAKRRAELIADGWDDLSADLFCDALDLAADLIDARAQISALTAEHDARVMAEAHARAVRDAFVAWAPPGEWACDETPSRHGLLATLTPIVGADRALALVDGGASRSGFDVPATDATRARIDAHAERTGRTRATVAGDFLEAGAIAAIHDAMGNGVDEAVWPSGLTAAEAVAKMRATLDAVAALVGGGDVVTRVADLVVALEQREQQDRMNYSSTVEST